jgi:NADP-dependent 3-hydroxy acid dehydrogenase YdfG
MTDLTGQIAIVTGASSGIGRGVARELNAAGMKLVLTARRTERLEELAREVGEAVVVSGDISDEGMPQRLIDTAVQQLGRCDVVINNAGIMETAEIEKADVNRLCHQVRVNFEAVVRVAYTALRHFKKVGGGHLINISSILGTKVRPEAGVYAGTKYAVEALTEALRMEVAGSGVRVASVEPGLVETELQDHFEVHPREMFSITEPLQPADIARCIRFILEQPPRITIPRMMVMPSQHGL